MPGNPVDDAPIIQRHPLEWPWTLGRIDSYRVCDRQNGFSC